MKFHLNSSQLLENEKTKTLTCKMVVVGVAHSGGAQVDTGYHTVRLMCTIVADSTIHRPIDVIDI